MTINATELVSIRECARKFGIPHNSLFHHIQINPGKYTQVRIGNSVGVIPSEFNVYVQTKITRKRKSK